MHIEILYLIIITYQMKYEKVKYWSIESIGKNLNTFSSKKQFLKRKVWYFRTSLFI